MLKSLRHFGVFLLGLNVLALASAEPIAAEVEAFEAGIRKQTESEQVTIVHFWASWCPNCEGEHRNHGWKRFIAAHPDVKVIFVSIWGSSAGDRKMLEEYGLTELPNFEAVRHPNQSRRRGERMTQFLGLPVTWVPSTWVYRRGQLRYAWNYGEIRFDILDQLVTDASQSW